ncbi:DUF2249 domain-containing protein [Sinomonas sp. R1AF57]|jgi:uncharacterized protein (DUF2249 family)|uniref:DUF2249 domain-containing protein n=1 Tax=Sinomonas sp. R1AF57 TaxID=2020377 RepID=UPI000B5E9FFE|nr:DUF2249 domain-containing protein [Sinomonas sp. R1AF57]ASN51609.1 hemerythrin [Sinomonas sp. R1AF57]
MDTQRQPLTLTPTSSCACGEHDGEGFPELDVRLIPHAIRHATIFGALDSLAVGAGLVIIANHNPLPLLAQVQQRYREGAFEVSYLAEGPEEWKVQFRREA